MLSRRWWQTQCVAAMVLLAAAGTAFAQAEDLGPLSADISGFGQPLPAVAAHRSDMALFLAGQRLFSTPLSIPILGPLFNNRTCVACHFQPTMGGSGEFISEAHTRSDTSGLPVHTFAVDNILRGGSQSQGAYTIFAHGLAAVPLGCEITDPNCKLSPCQQQEAQLKGFSPGLPICDPTSAAFANGDNCTAQRQSTNLFGAGLVEAVADDTLIALAKSEPTATRGVPRLLTEFGAQRVARFGWKDDGATLRTFVTLATSNELGLTTPDAPQENTTCADGVTQFGILLDAGQEPEDTPDATGHAMIDRIVDFLRALAPPPRLSADDDNNYRGSDDHGGRGHWNRGRDPQGNNNSQVMQGEQIFSSIGCAGCHTPTLVTAPDPSQFIPPTTGGTPISPTLNRALANQTFHPFSDFLLHDMGSLGDGITSGTAGPTMMRTAPLWGVRSKVRLLHDGRADNIATAIILHDGEGLDSAQQFENLSASDQAALLSFLNTL
jgi:CxxC motif-containing protein (DUF1111 family)